MQPVAVPIDEQFQVVLVASEERADEPGGYEPVVADPRTSICAGWPRSRRCWRCRWCRCTQPSECDEARSIDAAEPTRMRARQKPFQNLRDMLRQSA